LTIRRDPARIGVFAGSFASQQLAFAHLLDVADRAGCTLDPDCIEVVPTDQRETRLAHYFAAQTVTAICASLVDWDTCILVIDPNALPARDTEHLHWVGSFDGTVVRARTDKPC
jgi:hypothetical protein